MADPFGFTDGAKALTDQMEASRKASHQLTGSIENVQKEAASVAQQRAAERKKARFVSADMTIVAAVQEWERLKLAKEGEAKIKADITRKYGAAAWTEIEAIKRRKLKEQQEDKQAFDADMVKARRVMICCYVVAAWIAYYIVWGSKK